MRRNIISGIATAAFLCILILDTKTAFGGVSKGLSVCLETIVPSLFPFIVVSKILSGHLSGRPLRLLRPIAYACGVPEGFESVLAIGFLGGYPIGASIIGDAYEMKILDRNIASRLLGFCNNAGPSFIFGMTVFLFDTMLAGWCIWFIQILSAVIVGIVLPGKSRATYQNRTTKRVTWVQSLESSAKTMGIICAWVIIFRVVIAYLEKWLNWVPDGAAKFVLIGSLELSNGCLFLERLPSHGVQFVIINALLSLGGVCVLMQTQSAARGLKIDKYIQGKALQCEISIFLAVVMQEIIFSENTFSRLASVGFLCLGLSIFQSILLNRKKVVASRERLLYN